MIGRCCVSLLLLLSVLQIARANEPVSLLVDVPLSGPAAKALSDFESALKSTKCEPRRVTIWPDGDQSVVVVGIAGESPNVDRLLAAQRIEFPKAPESLSIRKLQNESRTEWLIAGRDTRGLSYALLDATRAVELSPPKRAPLESLVEETEAPLLQVRSISVHPFNADVDAEWYFSDDFWRTYFARLARDRFNNFLLTFSDQTNYLNPIYAYVVDVPGFPNVRVRGLTAEARSRNLAMLRRIAELAAERGLDFTLGIWMQAPVPAYAGEVLVENLPTGLKAADYCAGGLKQILQACPAISGVQFRMNAEAGVSEEQQTEFYRPLFQAIRDCGRPIKLDLRFKGLQPATTKSAVDLGLDVTVSTKFWCEHFGLPYHPTVSDKLYRKDRYSFGAMLEKPRPFHVVYQLWTVGSQRLLLWGDPDYAAQFARSCQLGDGEGFEVFAPLTNKGYGNAPGHWRIFANKSDEHFTWEHDRYWFFTLCFGRMGFNPKCNPEVWRREFRHRFGVAAAEIESAYRSASKIIPLITAAHLPSASEWRWWPEMDTGGALTEYMHTPPSDTGQFYGIRTWKSTPRWAGDPWDNSIPGYVDDAVSGRPLRKSTPIEISQNLRQLANETERALAAVPSASRRPKSAEQIATERDLRILACLARYHSEKILAATQLAFFEATKEAGRLPVALKHARAAEEAWQQIAALTDRVYHDNLVFGIARGSPRSKLDQHHSGHWKDRVLEVIDDVALIEKLLDKHGGNPSSFRKFPGETALDSNAELEHTPVEQAQAGTDLKIQTRLRNADPRTQLILHYRPLNQTVDWKEITMTGDGKGALVATLPGREMSDRWDLQYYIEILERNRGARLWPSWKHGPPFVVVTVTK